MGQDASFIAARDVISKWLQTRPQPSPVEHCHEALMRVELPVTDHKSVILLFWPTVRAKRRLSYAVVEAVDPVEVHISATRVKSAHVYLKYAKVREYWPDKQWFSDRDVTPCVLDRLWMSPFICPANQKRPRVDWDLWQPSSDHLLPVE